MCPDTLYCLVVFVNWNGHCGKLLMWHFAVNWSSLIGDTDNCTRAAVEFQLLSLFITVNSTVKCETIITTAGHQQWNSRPTTYNKLSAVKFTDKAPTQTLFLHRRQTSIWSLCSTADSRKEQVSFYLSFDFHFQLTKLIRVCVLHVVVHNCHSNKATTNRLHVPKLW